MFLQFYQFQEQNFKDFGTHPMPGITTVVQAHLKTHVIVKSRLHKLFSVVNSSETILGCDLIIRGSIDDCVKLTF